MIDSLELCFFFIYKEGFTMLINFLKILAFVLKNQKLHEAREVYKFSFKYKNIYKNLIEWGKHKLFCVKQCTAVVFI